MIYLPTGEQMRRADLYTIEEIGVPSMVLMERAALEVVRCMEEEQLDFRKVLVICGSGSNKVIRCPCISSRLQCVGLL